MSRLYIGNRGWVEESEVNRPFGVILPNGMNFAKSVHNSNSVLRRILKVVDDSPVPLTKKEILNRVGYVTDVIRYRVSYRSYKWVGNRLVGEGYPERRPIIDKPIRGYLSWYFSAMNKAGFIRPVRQQGNRVVWVKGNNFPNLSKMVEV